MPIDFPDLLRSTLLSGKLIFSNAIKASPAKKVVQDVRDTTNQVEIDLEDNNGTITTATIPKGAAVDATAREAAAEAQADIDDHEANHPEGGGGGETTPLSDDTPESTGGADAGVGTDASRGDHVHNVPNATTTLRGISEKATGGEATTGTNNEAHMTPLRVSQVFTNRAGDADPVAPAAPTVGTSTNFSREDHGHGVEQRVLNQDPNADADYAWQVPDRPAGERLHHHAGHRTRDGANRRLRPVHPRRLHRGAFGRAKPAGPDPRHLLLPHRRPQAAGDGQQLVRATPMGGCPLV